MSLPKASLNICFGFFISVLPFPFAGWRQGCRSAAPAYDGCPPRRAGRQDRRVIWAPRRSANDRPPEARWPLVRLAAGTLRRAGLVPSGSRLVIGWRRGYQVDAEVAQRSSSRASARQLTDSRLDPAAPMRFHSARDFGAATPWSDDRCTQIGRF